MKRFSLLLAFLLIVSLTACAPAEEVQEESGLPSFETVLCLSPAVRFTEETLAEKELLQTNSLSFFSTTVLGINALLNGNGDAFLTLQPVADFYGNRTEGLNAQTLSLTAELRMLVTEGNTALLERLNSAITDLQADGSLTALYDTWVTAYAKTGRPEDAEDQPVLPSGYETTLRIGISGSLPLVDYVAADGQASGYTKAFAAALSRKLQANVEFVQILPDAKVSSLLSNKIDAYLWHFLDTPANCAVTEVYASCPMALLTVN